jgi:glycosyltransferase involved in cell wall biosynthesis
MKIALFIPTYNEAYTLDQILTYYRANGVTEIFVFDNGSTDNTREIAMRHNATILETKTKDLDDRNYLHIKNHVWKKIYLDSIDGWLHKEFDFIICCDADEVLYHPDGLANALKWETKSVIKSIGWNVYSELAPDPHDILKVSTGFPDPNFGKCVCFDPKRIESMNYGWGAHECNPVGDVTYNWDEYYLLHFRCLGGVQRMIDRHREYSQRMSAFNQANGYGFHYLRSEAEIQAEWERNISRSEKAWFINHNLGHWNKVDLV